MPRRGRANGEGTIFEYPKRSGIWYAQLTLEDGSRRKRRASSQREARELLRQMQQDVAQGVQLTIQQPTVGQWCLTWLETYATHLKPNIRESYASVIDRHIVKKSIGKRRLDKLTPAEVQAWINTLARTLAPKTVRNIHARLHKALEVAVRHGYVGRNIAHGVDLPSVPGHTVRPLTLQEVRMVLDSVTKHRWAALYRLAINLGMREGELLGLTWEAINFEAGTIRIYQQLRRARLSQDKDAPRTFMLQSTKTKAGERTLTVDKGVLSVLQLHRELQQKERDERGEAWEDPFGSLVFTTETGAPVHVSRLLDHFRSVLHEAKLPRIRFHDLRHTAATLMLANGVPLVTVSKILGHSSPSVTAAIYAHALDESKAEAIAALSQQLN